MPWDDEFHGWIVDHDLTVFHAHNMWIDVFLQLGVVGVAVALVVFVAAAWRAWFFAIDRPRWDLEANRPYSALSLAPLLIMAVLLTQGLTESGPLMLWGWMLVGEPDVPHQAGARHRRRRGRVTAGCAVVRLTDRPRHRSAMIRMLRARLIDLLGSADFARVYTLIALGTALSGLRHRASRVRMDAVLDDGWPRRRRRRDAVGAQARADADRVRPDDAARLRAVGTGQRGVGVRQVGVVHRAGWNSLCYAFVAVTIAQVRDTMQVVRALGDVLRALLGLSIALEVLVGILLDTSFPQLAIAG